MSEQPDAHRCGQCGEQYPVPSLARDCEASHFHPLRAKDVPGLVKKHVG